NSHLRSFIMKPPLRPADAFGTLPGRATASTGSSRPRERQPSRRSTSGRQHTADLPEQKGRTAAVCRDTSDRQRGQRTRAIRKGRHKAKWQGKGTKASTNGATLEHSARAERRATRKGDRSRRRTRARSDARLRIPFPAG